jgi:hypothetical protein
MIRGGLHFWYKNKRSRELRSRIPIEMEEFAKTIHAFKFGPHDAWGGTAQLFDTGKEGSYSYVFGDGESVWTKVPNDEFYLLSGIWFLCEDIRRIWKLEKTKRAKDENAGLALERRYMVYFAVGELLKMIYADKERSLDDEIRRLGRPKWTEKDGPEKKSIGEVTKLAFSGLTKAYESASRQEDFRHRNWFRSKTYLEGIRSELRFIVEIKGTDSIGLHPSGAPQK